MQLDVYIKDLLYRYECVIVPGFGAFLTHNEPACIDTETHTFYPPCKRISFNRQLQTNDGLLANYIAKSNQIPYESALQQIRQKASWLKHELSSGKTIAFSNIGHLEPDANGNVAFVPDASINYLTGSFGLASYNSPAIERAAETQKDTPVVPLSKPSRRIPIWRYAAVGLIAIGLASFSGMYFYADGVKQHNVAEKQKANQLLENKIQQATFVVNNPLPELNIKVEKTYGNYHIVAGAFRVQENAESKIEQLKAKGFEARAIGINKYGLHQIVYGSFHDRLKALRQLRHIKNTDNPDAWLLVEKLQK